jgi:general secretion pathway protein G
MVKFWDRLRNQQGMSLIEILIVLGIIAASMAAILNTVFTSGDKAKIKQAETEIAKLTGFVKLYKQDTGKYPTGDQGLDAIKEAGFMEDVPLDPWKNEYIYESPGSSGKKFDICSEGPDDETEEDNICRK